ncbi:hypothetical protein JYU34_013768 [Plutella xylostella]|uniref:Lipase domain-containing protein n=1 Tax=Plutella xylostella TaxID=51655 RepID=A0ABQ7QAW3_PLUXY|nr:hypothetical protein JYU34_013768 [Plutella xylostella]
MNSSQYYQLVCLYQLLLLELCSSKAVYRRDHAKFSLGSMFDTGLSFLHPAVAAGSSRCDNLKSFFGLTYEQIQEKNATDFFKQLTIDLITNDTTLKYNLTHHHLGRVLNNATQIVILIHGFLESSDGWMVQAVAPGFLKMKNYMVLALDARNVITIDYFRSSTYARFMGMKLGSTLAQVIQNGQDPSNIMLVGHSLGAHVAGIAGQRVAELTGRKLARITGLDPALPCFPPDNPGGRLDATDADYVDVIHTNGGILGMKESVGHKDFYPNGGLSQPGCYLSTCDHSRAWELYAESIGAPKGFPARKCENWTSFREGHCSKTEVTYMGLNSLKGSPGAYFLTTGPKPPFGLGPTGSG